MASPNTPLLAIKQGAANTIPIGNAANLRHRNLHTTITDRPHLGLISIKILRPAASGERWTLL